MKLKEKDRIPVIDLFAGPGGLAEGFSSVSVKGKRIFDIKLSIEKDENAHRTLELRSFYRQFDLGHVPDEYYNYVRNYNYKTDIKDRSNLFNKYKRESEKAINEAWRCTLGDDHFPPETVDKRIKIALKGQKDWVLIGGPPCQAYSLVGRSRNKGISEDDQRVYLYREYLRIIAVHHPAIFVMENVKGLLSAKLHEDKIFDWIKKDLKDPGYLFPNSKSPKYRIYSFVKSPVDYDDDGDPVYSKDQDYLIRTEDYGIPQNRHRVILLGIREDIGKVIFNSLESSPKINLSSVIDELPKLRSELGREINGTNAKGKNIYRKLNDSGEKWTEILNVYLSKINGELRKNSINLKFNSSLKKGSNYIEFKKPEKSNPLFSWYNDPKLGGVLNHETRSHLKEDLGRYLFSSLHLKVRGEFPKLRDYPDWLLPMHKNAKGGKFADRFRTQRPDRPATTITSHISKDGHYFIHYDPSQCRSLTVREAARVQTFPDNYLFCGSRTHQYHQVGNAVPPLLAKQLAEIVLDIYRKING